MTLSPHPSSDSLEYPLIVLEVFIVASPQHQKVQKLKNCSSKLSSIYSKNERWHVVETCPCQLWLWILRDRPSGLHLVLKKNAPRERHFLTRSENTWGGKLISEAFAISDKAVQIAKTRKPLFQPIAIFLFSSWKWHCPVFVSGVYPQVTSDLVGGHQGKNDMSSLVFLGPIVNCQLTRSVINYPKTILSSHYFAI